MATAVLPDDPEAALAAARALVATDPAAAAAALTPIVDRHPDHCPALRLLARALRGIDEPGIAAQLDQRAIDTAARRPAFRAAIAHFAAGRLDRAEAIARRLLGHDAEDVAALCLLSEIARRASLLDEAERLLRRAKRLAPDFTEAQVNLARLMAQRGEDAAALTLLDDALAAAPDDDGALAARLAITAQSGDYASAIALYEHALGRRGRDARLWTDFGYLLRTVGRREEAAHAFRAALAIDAGVGEAWLGLSHVAHPPLDLTDVAAMESALGESTDARRSVPMHFALGRALEGLGRHAASFRHYAAANRIQRGMLPYDADATSDMVDRAIASFTPERVRAAGKGGTDGVAPIFIVGMPRSGSSLVEQILASHPAIEGLCERPDIPRLVARVLGQAGTYPEALTRLTSADLRALGQSYLRSTAASRRTARPFFVDKLPENWAYIGFIHLILPEATIIDVRRDPQACGFSNFAQYFPRGHGYSNDLVDLARYQADYRRVIDHIDGVLPGRIHRLSYEALVADPEAQIRALLHAIGLPFDAACLRPHENYRPVPTPSAEQVRRPINHSGIDRAKPYAAWLSDMSPPKSPEVTAPSRGK